MRWSRIRLKIGSFSSLPLSPDLLNRVQSSFPSIRTPTHAQSELITRVTNGYDVLLKADTGDGKSLGLLLSLLSQASRTRADEKSSSRSRRVTFDPLAMSTSFASVNEDDRQSILGLIMVPTYELLRQYTFWSESLYPQTYSSYVGALYRSPNLSTSDQVLTLRSTIPKVLVCTPNGLADALAHDPSLFNIQAKRNIVQDLSCIALDEVDALLPSPSTRRSTRSFKKSPKKKKDVLYPLIDALMGGRDRKIQFIATSASLNAPLRGHLKVEKRWAGPATSYINADTSDKGTRVRHCCVVVNNRGEIRNIRTNDSEIGGSKELQLRRNEVSKFLGEANEDENLFESVAAAFAIWSAHNDNNGSAVLIVPSNASIKRLEDFFGELGLNARQLVNLSKDDDQDEGLQENVGDDDKGTLYITHEHAVRGLHMPSLELVMIAGPTKDVTKYSHISGRVGRFGQSGSPQVVTFVRETVTDDKINGEEEKAMQHTFNRAKITPEPWNTVVE
ncbi:hypothetical protein E3P81_03562 [Wallemia ichthyophaga]|nr:hypothetical protein E3P91_03493 [Wallemia ichthyophaga]TIA79161.1 hypothetical protein E3P98_03448 [Wallemia ichthyophaga]TIA88217.1 hypothetical protein E3P97_03599 [Wallemia ichthyophaga]TIA96044.1 hypothetical protein E3P95_03420 [Wallemia ichthyophaga]TIB05125.1 hypothetical protein E3P96_01394 [Wallemia ichthyophaga]